MRTAGIVTLTALFAVALIASSDDSVDLRARGQGAVDELHANGADDALLDRVCAQKDCRASRLFWHTDLDAALEAAKREGKPVVSLHLLGRLDEELSCANSRFFRVMLYSDPAISALLRERFVLHWRSVRPVPVVTIDIGNGRTIRQTITGNSLHYLLDENGNVLDALPGLYSPQAFRQQLQRWTAIDAWHLRAHHEARLQETAQRWRELGLERIVESRPTAEAAAMQAMSKVAIERPLLAGLDLGASLRVVQPYEWQMIGEHQKQGVEFSAESIALMRTKQDVTGELLDNLQRTVAADTIFNELEHHRRIHAWFARGQVRDLASLNDRIYRELFLTPPDDPWMGLSPDAVFAALGNS